MRTLLEPFALTLVLLSPAYSSAQESTGAVPHRKRGSVLYTECKTAIRIDDSGNFNTSPAQIGAGANCISYVLGVTDAWSDPGIRGVGVPCYGDATVGTIMRVYVRFMETHPKYLDEQRWLGVYRALAEAYPCKK